MKYSFFINNVNYNMDLQNKILMGMGLVIVVGYGYSMDMPQALQAPLRDPPYNLTSIQINLLYFATYLPVLITDIPLGIILDRFPMQKTVIIIALSSFLSELAVALLFDFRPEGYLYGVLIMRAITGMAGSSAFTMQGFVMARYASQYYQIMMGFGLSLPYIFDAINITLAPLIFDRTHSISLPWYIASIIDFFAVIAAVIIAIIINRKQREKKESLIETQSVEEQQQQQEFKVNYLLEMPKLFWIVIVAILVNQLTMCIFTNLNDLIINRFKFDYVITGHILIIPYLLASLLTLLLGKVMTVKPKLRRTIILISSILTTIGIGLLYFLPNNNQQNDITSVDYIIIAIFLILLSFMASSMYTVLASSVSLLADPKRLGTAWGVIGTAIGLGQSISPLINGFVEKQDNLMQSYTTLTLIYLCVSVVGIGLSLWIALGPYSIIDINFHESKKSEKGEHNLRVSITTQNSQMQI